MNENKQIKATKTAITKEENALRKLYCNIAENDRELAERLIKDAAFYKIQMEQAREAVIIEGRVREDGKKNPEITNYNEMSRNYGACITKLKHFLPKIDPIANDGFEEFLNDK